MLRGAWDAEVRQEMLMEEDNRRETSRDKSRELVCGCNCGEWSCGMANGSGAKRGLIEEWLKGLTFDTVRKRHAGKEI
jgi:hypothetical protein